MIADYAQIARETRHSVALNDAVLERLRNTEDLIFGRSRAEMAADRIVEIRQSCARHAEFLDIMRRWAAEILP